VCDDFGAADVDAWATSPAERESLNLALRRVAGGEADYLTIRSPSGVPVAKCGINYAEKPGIAVIYQFDTREGLRSLGLGHRLLSEAERRAR